MEELGGLDGELSAGGDALQLLTLTGVERPKPGRLMRVTRRDSASGPRTPSKTVRSVSSECNSRRPGPLPVWSCWTSSSSSAGMAYCGAVAGNSNVAVMTSFSRSRGGL